MSTEVDYQSIFCLENTYMGIPALRAANSNEIRGILANSAQIVSGFGSNEKFQTKLKSRVGYLGLEEEDSLDLMNTLWKYLGGHHSP